MSDLADFLLARIAEDEAVARTAESGPWTADGGEVWAGHPSWSVVDYARGGGGTAEHIARWDPARVLAECDAKRRIVAEVQEHVDSQDAWSGWVLFRALALPYADHPDWREEWRP